ncbi:MAG: hypothetical protein HYZ21_10905 [Chloroflexi bacterium]|nr:hypothetical protein [Chloroflexota bacterium]
MSKNDNDDFNPAEDYLAQLDWKTKPRRHSSVYYEPKWRYKIVYKNRTINTSYLPLIILTVPLTAVFIYLLYLIFFEHSLAAIAGLVFFISVVIILFFAVRDAERGPKDDE